GRADGRGVLLQPARRRLARHRRSATAHVILLMSGQVRAATAVCSLSTRPGLARVAAYVAQVGQARLALGRGVVVVARGVSVNCYPHPQPLPSRLRACPLPAPISLTNPGK